jgi:hypothetical protein
MLMIPHTPVPTMMALYGLQGVFLPLPYHVHLLTCLSISTIISQFVDMPYRPMKSQQGIAITVGHDLYMHLHITSEEIGNSIM